jgi:PHYB activation tagged suppressor 1
VPTPDNRRKWREAAALKSILLATIAARRAARQSSAHASTQQAADILLDFLLDAHADTAHNAGSGHASTTSSSGGRVINAGGDDASATSTTVRGRGSLTDSEVMDESLTFILAGHETTSQSLCWTLLLLAEHPEWQERARAQVLAAVGRERQPTHADLAATPLIGWIINEAMRLYAPIPTIVRVATTDVTLQHRGDGGAASDVRSKKNDVAPASASSPTHPLRITAGTMIAIHLCALHREEALWSNPHTFDPMRWQHGMGATLKHPLAFVPFSSGPRNCVGAQFALLEAKLILAAILQRLAVEPAPEYVHQPHMVFTLRPKHGMPLRLRRVE